MFLKIGRLYLNTTQIISVEHTKAGNVYVTTTELTADASPVAEGRQHLLEGEEATAFLRWLTTIAAEVYDVVAHLHCAQGVHRWQTTLHGDAVCAICGWYRLPEEADARTGENA